MIRHVTLPASAINTAANDNGIVHVVEEGTITQLMLAPGIGGTSDYTQLTNTPTLGTAAATASTDYATSAQGTKADTAIQAAGLTKAAVGLGNCDNTSDAGKPISTATQTALDTKGSSNFSGAYADLTGKPTLGTAAATASIDYATAAQGAKADSALQSIADGSVTLAKQANMATASVLYRKTAGTGVPEVQTVATLKTDLGLTGTNSGDQTITLTGDVTGTGTGSFATAIKASVSLTTPVLGAATGTSLAVTGALTSSGTTGIGYASGAGGTVTQLTSKSTGVTLSKLCGTITTHNAALAAAAIVTFTVTNTLVTATDVVHVQHDSGGTVGAYTVMPNTMAAGSFKVTLRNNSAGSLSDAMVLRFVVVKAVAA